LDLVKLQIAAAAGEPLPFSQADVRLSGHAVECRLYAEDPSNQFFPSPGTILSRRVPAGPGIRLDDGVYEGYRVSTEYDPMLGKLIAYGATRGEAIARLDRALEEYSVTGIKTNTRLLLGILRDADFQRGEIFTRWLDERLPDLLAEKHGQDLTVEDAATLAAALFSLEAGNAAKNESSANGSGAEAPSQWKREARLAQINRNE
jgi:acetyl-CoA carboxylase biotin carboxylase subunit